MGRVLMTGGGGGGGSSDDCTATANDVLKGKTAVYNGSGDEPQEGTLELTGDAADGYVYSGKTYYNTDARTKRTGTMTVGSILNFSAAAYSGRQVLLKWQNPYAATGKPFGGVFINYGTGGYPGTGGTRIYTGYGNNSAPGGWSQVIVTLPNLNTTYYFSCTAYVSSSAGDIWGNTINAVCNTSGEIWQNITWSQNYTIPAGYNYVDIFCVGGGGGGRGGYNEPIMQNVGGGGGGGYTSTAWNIAVSAGQVLYCSIGAGGAALNRADVSNGDRSESGGTSQVSRSGNVLCSAAGGQGGDAFRYGGNGGSGGGAPGWDGESSGHNGGTNGGNGADGTARNQKGGTGQGRTTRPWGGSSGTVYSGGGGGGGTASNQGYYGTGGNYGGGNGGSYKYGDPLIIKIATAGQANSGGGGGGGHGGYYGGGGNGVGGAGGSGIIILHLH